MTQAVVVAQQQNRSRFSGVVAQKSPDFWFGGQSGNPDHTLHRLPINNCARKPRCNFLLHHRCFCLPAQH